MISFPAASPIFLSSAGFGFTATQYGFLFAPQVLTPIPARLLGGVLSRRLVIQKIYRIGLLADLVAMALLAGGQLLVGDRSAAYLVLLIATAFLGTGFGLTVPALNALVAGLRPAGADRAVLLLNALLGLGTALAPAFTAIFLGLGFWWGLPLLVIATLLTLLIISHRLPVERAVPVARRHNTATMPPRFYLFAAVAVLYGLAETISGNWSGAAMGSRFGAGTTVAALSLTAFRATVTFGRLLFATLETVIPPRWVFRSIPMLIIAACLLIAIAHRPGPAWVSHCSPSPDADVPPCCPPSSASVRRPCRRGCLGHRRPDRRLPDRLRPGRFQRLTTPGGRTGLRSHLRYRRGSNRDGRSDLPIIRNHPQAWAGRTTQT